MVFLTNCILCLQCKEPRMFTNNSDQSGYNTIHVRNLWFTVISPFTLFSIVADGHKLTGSYGFYCLLITTKTNQVGGYNTMHGNYDYPCPQAAPPSK